MQVVFSFVMFSGLITGTHTVLKRLRNEEKYNDELDWELPSDA